MDEQGGYHSVVYLKTIMKKFRFDPVKRKDSLNQSSKALEAAKQDSKSQIPSKDQAEKAAKKSQIQKQIEMLNEKISSANSNIKQTEKMLDIDLFLKKQKQKRLDYAKKLNEQYEHDKKERQRKLYKQNQRGSQTQKLQTGTIRSEMPLNIFGAIEQIQRGQSAVKKWVFEDHYHKLDELLLDKTKNQLLGETLRNAEQECLKEKSDNVWKRAKEVTVNSAEMKYFPVTIQQNNLEPSDMGETLMSILTLMPPALSEILYQECSDVNRQNYFLLKFFAGGEKKCVLTDEWIEVREFVHKFVNVGCRSKDNLSFWSTIIEKGFKKLYHRQYQTFTLAEMCQTVYGLDPQLIPFNNKIIIRQNFPKILNTLLKSSPKGLIGFINDRTETNQRIYPLTEIHFPVIPSSSKKKKSKQTSVPVPTDILYQVKNPYAGKILSSTFINKFTINQLYEKFNRIIVVRELPKKWSGIRIFIQFLSNGPISFTGNSWTQNSQFSFTINKSSQARLALRRRWGSYIDSGSQPQSQDSSTFGFMLFKSQEGETEVSVLKLDALIQKSKSTDESGCLFDCFLQKGTYILIPFSHAVSQQYMQLMNLDIFVERQDAVSVNKSRMNQYFYQNQETNGEKVLQKLQSRVRYEKPKSQKIQAPKIFLQGEKPISIDYIEGLALTLMKETKNEDYFIPGKLKALLTNGEFKQEKKEKIAKRSTQNQEIERYEKEEALKTMLGYDVLMGEDINYGEMKTIVEETSDQIDFANFGLGEEGLMALLEPLMQMPRIVKLNLAHNELNDSVITYLCYYIQKGNRKELRELILTGNPIGKMGVRALRGLTEIYKDMKIIGVKM